MTPLLRAELLKLRTTRTFLALTGAAVGTSLLITVLVAILTEPTRDEVLTDVFTSDTSSLFIMILAVVGITGEWRHHTITSSLPLDRMSAITTPVLVLTSEGSDERLPTWGRWLRDTLPHAALRTLEGEWHGVAPEVLAPVLTEFFTPRHEV